MQLDHLPFNIFLLKLTPELLRLMRPTTTTEIFETGTRNFHPEGLFSTETFGPLGSKERDGRFSYVNLNTTIFHPLIYKRLGSLKRLYLDVIEGRRYATFSSETKDFEPSNEIEGETGFAFFVNHLPELELKEGDSEIRNLRVKLINENKDNLMVDKVLVNPAGLRDIHIEPSGRVTEDEINKFYRALISISSGIPDTKEARRDPILNHSRLQLQRNFNGIYELIFNTIKGKRGFALGKWASRKVINGTANVISPMKITGPKIGYKGTPGVNSIQVGIYQTIKAALPKTIYFLRSGFLGEVFSGNHSGEVPLTNPKTLMTEWVVPSPEEVEKWTTREGLEGQITRYKIVNFRSKPIRVDGYYLGLLYAGPEGFRFFHGIEELPEGFSKKNVYPITMTSLYYLSGYTEWSKLVGIMTRYPVTGQGSTVIGNIYCKSTEKVTVRAELGIDWKPIGPDNVCYEFPDQSRNASTFNSLGVVLTALSPLGADNSPGTFITSKIRGLGTSLSAYLETGEC